MFVAKNIRAFNNNNKPRKGGSALIRISVIIWSVYHGVVPLFHKRFLHKRKCSGSGPPRLFPNALKGGETDGEACMGWAPNSLGGKGVGAPTPAPSSPFPRGGFQAPPLLQKWGPRLPSPSPHFFSFAFEPACGYVVNFLYPRGAAAQTLPLWGPASRLLPASSFLKSPKADQSCGSCDQTFFR